MPAELFITLFSPNNVVYFLDNDQYPHEEADMKGKQYLYIRIDWHEGKSLICVIIYVRNIIDR